MMKITKSQLKQIIKEEISRILSEDEGQELPGLMSYITGGSENPCKELEDINLTLRYVYAQASGEKPPPPPDISGDALARWMKQVEEYRKNPAKRNELVLQQLAAMEKCPQGRG